MIDPSIKRSRSKRPHLDSMNQVTHSNFDISHTLTKNDYFSDINPKSMRRLMNIVAVTGLFVKVVFLLQTVFMEYIKETPSEHRGLAR